MMGFRELWPEASLRIHMRHLHIMGTTQHQADLIVLGSCYQRQGLHGAATHRLTHHSKVPVLIVPNCPD